MTSNTRPLSFSERRKALLLIAAPAAPETAASARAAAVSVASSADEAPEAAVLALAGPALAAAGAGLAAAALAGQTRQWVAAFEDELEAQVRAGRGAELVYKVNFTATTAVKKALVHAALDRLMADPSTKDRFAALRAEIIDEVSGIWLFESTRSAPPAQTSVETPPAKERLLRAKAELDQATESVGVEATPETRAKLREVASLLGSIAGVPFTEGEAAALVLQASIALASEADLAALIQKGGSAPSDPSIKPRAGM